MKNEKNEKCDNGSKKMYVPLLSDSYGNLYFNCIEIKWFSFFVYENNPIYGVYIQ